MRIILINAALIAALLYLAHYLVVSCVISALTASLGVVVILVSTAFFRARSSGL